MRCTKSGSGRNDLPEIREDLEHLRWLAVHIKHRQGTTNIKRKRVNQFAASEDISLDSSDNESDRDQMDLEENDDHCAAQSDHNDEKVMKNIEPYDGTSASLHNQTIEKNNCTNTQATMVKSVLVDEDNGKGELTDTNSVVSLDEGSTSGSSGCKTKKSRSKKENSSFSSVPKSRKRAWSKDKRLVSTANVARRLFDTMNSINKAISDPETPPNTSEVEADEEKQFCFSQLVSLRL